MSRELGAQNIHWKLEDLYDNLDRLEEDIRKADAQADAFSENYKGRVSSLEAPALADALAEFERILDRIGRVSTYAYLNWCTHTDLPERGALFQKTREATTQIHQKILFFEIEWVHVDENRADRLLKEERLSPYRHYLENQRLMKDHVLSEPEEKILSEKSITGSGAWSRFFEETLGATRFSFRGQELTAQEVLSNLYETDRQLRRDAAMALTEGLQSRLRELTFTFNIILADKASDDRLRRFSSWLSSRNLSNEISDESVSALIEAVTGRYDLVARFYNLKRKLLGLDELHDYDRYAPLEQVRKTFKWDQARDIVLDAYEAFEPQIAAIARQFFDSQWIDAPVRSGKRGGAFSHSAVPSAHPYIMLNYTGNIRDIQTLAHELGHGVHQYLSREQGLLQCRPPLTMAETASVFGEMLVFERLYEMETSPETRLAMLASKIDDTMATVFRQITMNLFEDSIHTTRRTAGELSSEKFGELWLKSQNEMFQGSVSLGDHYKIWWSYIPHFIEAPGYVYAYAFGDLLVLALYARYRAEGRPFVGKYLDLLREGGSDWPHVLIGKLGVDLNDSSFWQQGLSAIERLIDQAEELADFKGLRLEA
ncbi:MAG: M3 family oligoendopeptidase [Acidobacteriota bacterium]